MMATRCLELAQTILRELDKALAGSAECVRAVTAAKLTLVIEGCDDCPHWREVYSGTRPPELTEQAEHGEVRHGWQYHAASRRETYYRDSVVLPSCDRPSKALLRSQAGRCAGDHWTLVPVSEELQWDSAIASTAPQKVAPTIRPGPQVLLVWSTLGHTRRPQSGLQHNWCTADQSCATGAYVGPSDKRSRCKNPNSHVHEEFERGRCGCQGRQTPGSRR